MFYTAFYRCIDKYFIKDLCINRGDWQNSIFETPALTQYNL
ncbi:hypothetical protein BPUTSESOX_492 [uncultured Gammaproteobacteria bacterium]|nr:hypothetical protein [uncultured Gammaproteobacteria bacterium]SSC11113.1 hypothetical protein BPUTEOSOX_311 [thiotrophic endosymbiont of Bathymodiolus puteoserpentis (Logatchev)]CAC9574735.1 hypothetical protein [uncultured Gammaproteobacteria bacterium]CAC9575294.1 hypothetical protein [uncultured Gammaproteobacteria bacterium]CAC9970005.1 hypothetical protein [uncultured Gammaproteobacteria bacterium]